MSHLKYFVFVAVFVWVSVAYYASSTLSKKKLRDHDKQRLLIPREPAPTEGVYVLSLQGVAGADRHNDHRLDTLLDHFRSLSCMDVETVRVCPGVVRTRWGHGATEGYIKCLEKIQADGVKHAYVFEDDIRFVNRFSCLDMRSKLRQAPRDTFVLLFGGHQWHYNSKKTRENYRAVDYAYGAYGWSIRQENVEHLKEGFLRELQADKDRISPDVVWYDIAKQQSKTIYATRPLLVEHPAAWSNTWHYMRKEVNEST